jgi:UDPglucose--hexose-1-phosphate uridylyltransferase
VKRTVTALADGRELIYYHSDGGSVAEAPDERELPEPPYASQLRYDPVLDEWVAYASHRQSRIFLPPTDQCPLCPTTGSNRSEVPASDYEVVVFENRFPSFSQRIADDEDEKPPLPELTRPRPGNGRCEVVCFTPEHDSSFARLSPDRVRLVLDALAERTVTLGALPGVEQVFCFENRGVEIGVTLHHPHGQIYAYPFLPPRTATMLNSARRHAERTGGNLFADLLAAERTLGVRVVSENDHWTAYVPAAARWPFEVHVFPRRQVADLPDLTEAELSSFGPLYLDLLRRFDGLFGSPMPYISAWHQAPVRVDRDLAYLHLQLFSIRRAAGKLKYLAGSESAMGAFVNDVLPEEAARMLREVTVAPAS